MSTQLNYFKILTKLTKGPPEFPYYQRNKQKMNIREREQQSDRATERESDRAREQERERERCGKRVKEKDN